jgi:hypothetical protein
MAVKIGVHVNRRLRALAAVEEKADENTLVWDGKSVVRLLFALFAKNVIAELLVIFRQVR